MNWPRRAIPEQKFNVWIVHTEFTQEFGRNSWTFRFGPFFWFGLPRRLLTKRPDIGVGGLICIRNSRLSGQLLPCFLMGPPSTWHWHTGILICIPLEDVWRSTYSSHVITFLHADFGKEIPSWTLWRGPSWNCPFPSSLVCPLLYRTEGEKGKKKVPRKGEDEGWPAEA